MQIPDNSHPAWRKLVTRELQADLSFIAAKMLLMRIVSNMNGSPESIAKAIDEIRNLYVKNCDLPNVRKDMDKIF